MKLLRPARVPAIGGWVGFALGIGAVATYPADDVSAQASRRMALDDVRRLVRLADPQISPDGRTVLVVVSRADYEANQFVSE